MKKILTAILVAATFASCSKKDATIDPAPTVPGKKISSIQYTDNGVFAGSRTMTYDTKGRLLTNVEPEAGNSYSFNYESDTRLVVTNKKPSDGTLKETHECTLNNKGAIIQILTRDPAGNLTYTQQFTYDADNSMTKVKGFPPINSGYERVAEFTNGTISKTKLYHNGILSSTTDYFYEGKKPNKTYGSLYSLWPSDILFGKNTLYLITELKTYNASGALSWHTTVAYQFDAEGYVTKETANYLTPGDVSTATYQYQ